MRYGVALARLSEVPLRLAYLLLLPIQRPLGILSQEEERRANLILDIAADHASESGVEATEEICIARSRVEAIKQLAEDLKPSAVVVWWHGAGPFGMFDAGRALRKSAPCPVVVVGGATGRPAQASWPPRWLSESLLV